MISCFRVSYFRSPRPVPLSVVDSAMAVLVNDMEKFVIDVAPPKPLTDVSATLDDLLKHAELYYQVRRPENSMLFGRETN